MAAGLWDAGLFPGLVEGWLWDSGLFPGISRILGISHIIRYGLLTQESAEDMQYRVGPILFSCLFFLFIREKSHVCLVCN